MKTKFLVFCFLVILWPAIVLGAAIEFGWDANTEADLAGYRLYQSATSMQYTRGQHVKEIGAPTTTCSLNNVSDGKYFWVLTAFDTNGNESDWSNEVKCTVDETAPKPPTGLWALIKKLLALFQGGLTSRIVK